MTSPTKAPPKNPLRVVLCNGADCPAPLNGGDSLRECLRLNYRDVGDIPANIRLGLPNFVRDVYHLPDRFLDLLEIATYVYCADRAISRGPKNDVIYNRWARSFHFVVRVRDHAFWQQPHVGKALGKLLMFIAGDESYQFTFEPGHSTPPASLFDSEEFVLTPDDGEVILFSGGLDSLTGLSERLTQSAKRLYLVSHQSGHKGVIRTQNQLVKTLNQDFPNRIEHYRFRSGLTSLVERREETQRTRFVLYAAIAFALAAAQGKDVIYAYENGITSLNLSKQQSTVNGRASRTTHPMTMDLLRRFLSIMAEKPLAVETPFFWKTKTDVLETLASNGFTKHYDSTVSCTKAFNTTEGKTHCGVCSQCVDRRLAAHAAGLGLSDDNGTYSLDFLKAGVEDGEAHTTITDYLRLATQLAEASVDSFEKVRVYELTDIVQFLGVDDEAEAVHRVWELCNRYGKQVLTGVRNMRFLHEGLSQTPPKESLFQIVNEREYLKEPIELIVTKVCDRLMRALPIAFRQNPPKDENDLNDKISACLNTDKEDFQREFPFIAFALARTVPDHSSAKYDLLIETKYLRGSTTPSKVTDALAADLMKYTGSSYRLFVLFDPERAIHDDETFVRDFQRHPRCTVSIVR